jgi:hypothetical protein
MLYNMQHETLTGTLFCHDSTKFIFLYNLPTGLFLGVLALQFSGWILPSLNFVASLEDYTK